MALPMTDIERQRRLAEMARNKGQKWGVDAGTIARGQFGPSSPSGMAASGYAKDAPEQGGSIEGRQRISDSQRDYANQLRGKGMPKGREVGPLDVYVQPNWAESLEGAVNQGLGGYMAGQANKEDRAIDKERQLEKALALEKVDAQQAFENTNATDTLEAKIDANAATVRHRNLQEKRLQGKDDRDAEGTWDSQSVQLPDGSNGTVVFNDGEWRMGSKEGKKLTPAEATKLLEFSTQTTKLPASMQKDMADRRQAAYAMSASIEKIKQLDAEGKDTSGMRGLAMSFVPKPFIGIAENALFDPDEMKQRTKNAYIDSQVKEAITTGVLSDQDVERLEGLNIAAGGLTPQQQILRLQAISEIMGLYGLELDMSGNPEKKEDLNLLSTAELQKRADAGKR
jgi:hypothetical protein